MLSVVVFFSDGLMQLLYSPPFLLPIPLHCIKYISGTHLRRDTVIPQWFHASKAAAASDGHAVHC